MGFRQVPVIIFLIVTASCVFGLPRDTGFNNQHVTNDIENAAQEWKDPSSPTFTVPEFRMPGRISCLYDEATEDPVCQNHCLPKGYSYGICVSKTCSCV